MKRPRIYNDKNSRPVKVLVSSTNPKFNRIAMALTKPNYKVY